MKCLKLKENDFIGVISSSGLLKEKNIQDINDSIENAKNINLQVKLGNFIYRNDDFYDEQVIENKIIDFNNMLEDNDIKMIMFSRGGHDCNLILDKLNYGLINETKKIYVGISDLTCILNAIYAKTGLITYHFCIFKGFLKGNKEFNAENFINTFFKEKKKINLCHDLVTIKPGVDTGTLIGGNIITLSKIIDTEYMPHPNKYILFLEECDEVSKEQLEQLILNMKDKLLKNASGILIGNYSIDNDYLTNIIKNNTTDIPILKCTDFGHCENNVVLPIGSKVKLDCDKKELYIIDDLFE